MIFKYGSYSHDQDEVMLRVSSQGMFDRFMRRIGDVHEWTILGVAKVDYNSDPEVMKAALTTKLDGLIAAYNVDYQDAGLYHDDGTTLTRHAITSADTFGGVKVVSPPSFFNVPWTGRPEYLNLRTYQVVLRFELRVGSGQYSWHERITIRGTGGSKWRYSPRMVGTPQAQTLQTATSFWYVQEGEAIGRQDWVTPSDPLWPTIEHEEMRIRTFDTPKDMVVGGNEMFHTSWKYYMEATTDQGFSAFILPSITG